MRSMLWSGLGAVTDNRSAAERKDDNAKNKIVYAFYADCSFS